MKSPLLSPITLHQGVILTQHLAALQPRLDPYTTFVFFSAVLLGSLPPPTEPEELDCAAAWPAPTAVSVAQVPHFVEVYMPIFSETPTYTDHNPRDFVMFGCWLLKSTLFKSPPKSATLRQTVARGSAVLRPSLPRASFGLRLNVKTGHVMVDCRA